MNDESNSPNCNILSNDRKLELVMRKGMMSFILNGLLLPDVFKAVNSTSLGRVKHNNATKCGVTQIIAAISRYKGDCACNSYILKVSNHPVYAVSR